MAVGRRLELLVFFSTAGSTLLDLLAAVMCTGADPYDAAFRLPNRLMRWSLLCGAFPWGGVLLALQSTWLGVLDAGWEPTNVELLLLVAVECVVACFTFGVACAALAVDRLAVQHGNCGPSAAVCSLYLVAAAAACGAAALAAVSALGMLWILAARFRPARAA
ncbi:hypothetical protein D1007_11417 [Hordeum vulgare]|nr:hypothetical protein D1007_11417 [Hordeum vulgare]